MQDRDDDAAERRLPGPPDGARPVDPTTAPASSRAGSSQPTLPRSDSTEVHPTPEPVPPARDAPTWYRTDRERGRSLQRLANPWYRRLARGLVGMAFLAAAGVGVYFAARLVQDFLDRDHLPAEGAEVPTIRSTTIEIRSTTPAPVLDGTLTLDAVTGSFEFVGRGTGPQTGMQVASPDGTATYVRRDNGAWQVAPAGDQLAADVVRAVGYLRDDDSADDILTPTLRRGYVELTDRVEVGEGEDELVRYEMRLDTASFAENSPLEFAEFANTAIPGVASIRGLVVTITLDDDDVLVQVDDDNTNWAWQRLSYSDQAFVAIDPSIG